MNEVSPGSRHCVMSHGAVLVVAKDGKKVREKVRKIASKVEEEDFSGDLEMV